MNENKKQNAMLQRKLREMEMSLRALVKRFLSAVDSWILANIELNQTI